MENQAVEQLKSFYSQIFNLIEETKKLIANGSTNEAVQKASQIKNITKQITFAKKGTQIPENQVEEIKALELKAAKEIKSTLDDLIQIKINLKENINTVTQNKKLQNAYSSEIPRLGETFYEEE